MIKAKSDYAAAQKAGRLIASYYTLAGHVIPMAGPNPSPIDLASRIDAAARAGYVGIGVEIYDLMHGIKKYGLSGIKKLLKDAGLVHFETEVLTNWFADGDARAVSDTHRALLLETANEIETGQIKVIAATDGDVPMSRMIDEFGELCRQAASCGTSVNVEIYPESNIRALEPARALIGGANQPNGGLLIDIWHMARGGIAYEDISTLPAHMIKAVEIDDAAQECIGTIFEDTINRRKLPGEGDLDVQRFLRNIWDAGYQGLIGVEIVSEQQRALPLEDAARLSYEASVKQIALAAGT